ncbi:MAG: sigma-70 family RNA polymerase sigma factor [Ruminococcaceae bacterium]|nr:sigma-70 family RNA polymerase sigma factor [Oscillospiraceae bacterium]
MNKSEGEFSLPQLLISRDELITNNMGLVHACANKFRGRGVEYDDLYQAGCVGLIKAADNFDAERGFAFSTYAVPVILGEIRRIFRDGGSVKIGRALKEKARKALRERENLSLKLGREPTISEFAEYIGVDIAEAGELITVSMPTVSLTCDEETGKGQIDIPVDPPEELLSDKIALSQILSGLDEGDRRLIELRYFKGLTQVNVAKQLNMSQVQVSRKEKQLLLKMRKLMLDN